MHGSETVAVKKNEESVWNVSKGGHEQKIERIKWPINIKKENLLKRIGEE